MKRIGVYLNNLQNYLVQGHKLILIVMRFRHTWMTLIQMEKSIAYCNQTEIESEQLHRRFSHPSISRLIELQHRARHDFKNQIVEEMTRYCSQCQLREKSPESDKFKVPKQYGFNHTVIVNIFNIGGHNVLYTMDKSTSF